VDEIRAILPNHANVDTIDEDAKDITDNWHSHLNETGTVVLEIEDVDVATTTENVGLIRSIDRGEEDLLRARVIHNVTPLALLVNEHGTTTLATVEHAAHIGASVDRLNVLTLAITANIRMPLQLNLINEAAFAVACLEERICALVVIRIHERRDIDAEVAIHDVVEVATAVVVVVRARRCKCDTATTVAVVTELDDNKLTLAVLQKEHELDNVAFHASVDESDNGVFDILHLDPRSAQRNWRRSTVTRVSTNRRDIGDSVAVELDYASATGQMSNLNHGWCICKETKCVLITL